MSTGVLMDRSILDCLVLEFEHLIPALTVPDPENRHVLAAARGGGVTLPLRSVDVRVEVAHRAGTSRCWNVTNPAIVATRPSHEAL